MSPPSNNDWTVDMNRFGFTPRKLRVVCIGAGFSGLLLAYKLKHERPLDYVDLVIYERNPEIGGTWFDNNYPGVGCDIPAPSYVFPFEPNPRWSKFYVGGAEIQQYILNTAEKYGLREKVVLNTSLVKSAWNEEQAKWKLDLTQQGGIIHDEADILINATGYLNNWKWPDIEGLDTFEGKLVHSARWDPDYEWAGKKVAVIGNGASALQIVPSMQPKVAKLVNYIRQPTYILSNICGHLTKDGKGANFQFTEEEMKEFEDNPEKFLKYRRVVDNNVNFAYRLLISGSAENKMIHDMTVKKMRDQLKNNPEWIDKLIPDYDIGCRRFSPGEGYLEALQADNAKWYMGNIKRLTLKGIQTEEGEEEEFDMIICATGFNTTFIPPWEHTGRGSRRLDVMWQKRPEAYFSVCAADMPNYFMFAGPNCPNGHGSVPQMLNWSCNYMLDWIEKIAEDDIKSIAVKESVVNDYNAFAREHLKRMAWSSSCNSWYKGANNENTPTAMYPGSLLHFKAALEKIRGEHFDIRYNTSNPFRYLGNGEMAQERTEEGYLSHYITK